MVRYEQGAGGFHGKRRASEAVFGLMAGLGLTLAGACSGPSEPGPPPRMAIEIVRVSNSPAAVHSAPSASSKVLATYPPGESVSVYSKKDGWSEVSFGTEGSGWIASGDLEALGQQSSSAGIDKASVRFLRPPAPVTNRQATGLIVLEGSVNTEGRIYDVKTIQNTTGSAELERQNRDEFRRAVFAPILVKGRPVPFVYDYRIEY